MPALVWDAVGTHWYEAGVSKGVLYPMEVNKETNTVSYGKGVAWNGLTSVSESPDGADANDLWADNIKYATLRAAETFGGTIEAYTYPDEWAECDGSKGVGSASGKAGTFFGQQPRKSFGLCYCTEQGNDADTNIDDGQKIHIVYNCTASPSDRSYETINDSPDAITFSWEFTSNPVAFTDPAAIAARLKPVSCIVVDCTKVDSGWIDTLKARLYGTNGESGAEGTQPSLPTPDEMYKWATTGSFAA